MKKSWKKKWTRTWSVTLIAMLGTGHAMADGNNGSSFVWEAIQVSDHHVFNTDIEVDGATTLIRDFKNRVVTADISTGALEPDWAYSIWWVVFNRPQYCVIPYQCGLADLEVNGGNPRVRNSVFWGGGMVADGTGSANTVMRLHPGKTRRELFAQSKNWGLQKIRKAEIHLVIRSHGPAGIAGPVSKQVGTAGEACPESGCANVYDSVHPAPKK